METPSMGSQFADQNQEEIKQFKREIDERYKLSIANKIYTFPRLIRSIGDLISSDEEEEMNRVLVPRKGKENSQIIDLKMIKKKQIKMKEVDTS